MTGNAGGEEGEEGGSASSSNIAFIAMDHMSSALAKESRTAVLEWVRKGTLPDRSHIIAWLLSRMRLQRVEAAQPDEEDDTGYDDGEGEGKGRHCDPLEAWRVVLFGTPGKLPLKTAEFAAYFENTIIPDPNAPVVGGGTPPPGYASADPFPQDQFVGGRPLVEGERMFGTSPAASPSPSRSPPRSPLRSSPTRGETWEEEPWVERGGGGMDAVQHAFSSSRIPPSTFEGSLGAPSRRRGTGSGGTGGGGIGGGGGDGRGDGGLSPAARAQGVRDERHQVDHLLRSTAPSVPLTRITTMRTSSPPQNRPVFSSTMPTRLSRDEQHHMVSTSPENNRDRHGVHDGDHKYEHDDDDDGDGDDMWASKMDHRMARGRTAPAGMRRAARARESKAYEDDTHMGASTRPKDGAGTSVFKVAHWEATNELEEAKERRDRRNRVAAMREDQAVARLRRLRTNDSTRREKNKSEKKTTMKVVSLYDMTSAVELEERQNNANAVRQRRMMNATLNPLKQDSAFRSKPGAVLGCPDGPLLSADEFGGGAGGGDGGVHGGTGGAGTATLVWDENGRRHQRSELGGGRDVDRVKVAFKRIERKAAERTNYGLSLHSCFETFDEDMSG